jgi:KDO2-lipid IV(A) lauroyltransferase
MKLANAVAAPLRLLRRIRWIAEAAALWSCYGLISLLSVDRASGLVGSWGRTIGPRLGVTRRARRNPRSAFPHMPPSEVEAVVRGMWENLGRAVGELPHLGTLRTRGPGARIDLVGEETIEMMRCDGRPGIAFAAHLANWELPALVAALHGLPVTLVYRRSNNPLVDRLIQRCRRAIRGEFTPKGATAARRITEVMRAGGHLGLLVDQKTNNGIPAPFFGRAAMTTPILALCALKYRCPLVPVQVERLAAGGARFRITVHPPLRVEETGDRQADVRSITAAVNACVEGWIKRRPEQWMWLHNRWPPPPP